MQKMLLAKGSRKRCGGNLSIAEDSHSYQWIHRMWNFKFSNNLRKYNTLPGKYITPKDKKHFEINRRLAMQAVQKGHSTAAKFISLMNLH